MWRVGTKGRIRTRLLVFATRTANANMNDEGKVAYHHWHHHRSRCYRPHYYYDDLQMGPVGPRRRKVDLEMASPCRPLFLLLGRWCVMGDAWRARAPNSADAVVHASASKIVSRMPR